MDLLLIGKQIIEQHQRSRSDKYIKERLASRASLSFIVIVLFIRISPLFHRVCWTIRLDCLGMNEQ